MKSYFILCFLLVFTVNTMAKEPTAKREILLNNNDVEVVKLSYPVGTESGMHTHEYAKRVVYFVKGGKLELVPADKKQMTKVISVSDGKTLFLPSTSHNVRNIGETDIVIIETELK